MIASVLSTVARLAAVAALALVLSPALAAPPAPEGTAEMAKVLQPGPLKELELGDPNGVTVVEYGSVTCTHCATFDTQVFPAFKTQYIDTGKVHFVFREFSRNPLDVAAFVLARCEGDDKTLSTIHLLFAQQDKWAFADNPLDALLGALRPTGMSREQAMACLKDQSKAEVFTKILNAAIQDVKVQGTPTFVIDGKVYSGELSLDDLNAILKPLIK
jgi:protein-disulfide isomerase